METITRHSLIRAADEAVKLWSLASTQYPKQNKLILDLTTETVIETISNFALNARRAMEALSNNEKFILAQPRYNWKPSVKGEVVTNLWDALNRIIHAQKLYVGFEQLPAKMSIIDGGSVVIPYIQAETDRRQLAFIDPFALSHVFLYFAYPKLVASSASDGSESVH